MLIETTLGLMEEAELEKRVSVTDDDEWRRLTRTEYWRGAELVRADAHLEIKKLPPLFADAASLE